MSSCLQCHRDISGGKFCSAYCLNEYKGGSMAPIKDIILQREGTTKNEKLDRTVKSNRRTRRKHYQIIMTRKYQKWNLEKVHELFREKGFILLSTEYKNPRTKLNYICSCGNQSSITLDNFKRGKQYRKSMELNNFFSQITLRIK